jgi:hypothetical protein
MPSPSSPDWLAVSWLAWHGPAEGNGLPVTAVGLGVGAAELDGDTVGLVDATGVAVPVAFAPGAPGSALYLAVPQPAASITRQVAATSRGGRHLTDFQGSPGNRVLDVLSITVSLLPDTL